MSPIQDEGQTDPVTTHPHVLDAATNLSRVTLPVTGKSQVESLTEIFPETDSNPSAKSQIPIFLQIF